MFRRPWNRNGVPFLIVHVGVRSSFLRNAYEPWLRAALWLALLAALASMVAAALLSAVALRPLRTIGEQLERLTLVEGETLPGEPQRLEAQSDPLGRVNRSIDRLGRELRSPRRGLHGPAGQPCSCAGHAARRRPALHRRAPGRHGVRFGRTLRRCQQRRRSAAQPRGPAARGDLSSRDGAWHRAQRGLRFGAKA